MGGRRTGRRIEDGGRGCVMRRQSLRKAARSFFSGVRLRHRLMTWQLTDSCRGKIKVQDGSQKKC